jgi:Trk-type K+ transport system membrane component
MSDLSLLGFPSLIIMIGLMWIGASPGSTGGGIKTTTFSLAVRVAWNTVRGRRNLEISGREINPGTVSRVLSIIILSLIVIAAGFFCLLLTEEGKEPVSLLFETVSAYSTVGLSVAGTPGFSEPGKIILMLIMFIGRVGPLTLLTGLFISKKRKLFSYPSGDILIN